MPEEGKVTLSSSHPADETGRSASPQTERPDEEQRATVKWVLRTSALGVALVIGLNVVLYFYTGAWQMLAVAAGETLVMLSLIPAHRLTRRGKLDAASHWTIFSLMLAFGVAELFHAGITLYLLASGVLIILTAGNLVLRGKWGAWLAATGLFAIYTWAVNQVELFPRFDVSSLETPYFLMIGLVALLVLTGLWRLIQTYRRTQSIRLRLSFSSVVMVLLPVVVIGVVLFVVGSQNGRQQAVKQLESVAMIKEAEINSWVDSLHKDLDSILGVSQVTPRVLVLLQTPDPPDSQEFWVRSHLQRGVEQSVRFEELFLINDQGQTVISTDIRREGGDHSDQLYFREGLKGFYLQPPGYFRVEGQVSAIAARPIVGPDGQALGILAGRINPTTLSEIMGERAWLGETGEVYLVDRNHILLTALRFDESRYIPLNTEGVNAAIARLGSGSLSYQDYRGEPVIGVYRWLPHLQIALVAKQDRSEALSTTNSMLRVVSYVGLAAVAATVVASLFVSQSLARPLAALTETATQIAAGDLVLSASVERQDEIGRLAHAFNSMTAQLRSLIGNLEQRVDERTRALEQRSALLEASAEVARAASSILDAHQLIQEVVELIRERFDLYYVGLFLTDEAGEWAVLRAGTGEAGQAMLARGHRIKVGQGMIGWSIERGRARIALEAGEDAVRLATAELPDTRSEAALPLRSRNQVLGAITVQSDQPGAFDQDTIVVLQTMADQVAVALDNARLFSESQAALEATRRAYGEFSREAWTELLRAQPDLCYRSSEHGVAKADVWRPEMERALQEKQPVRGTGDSDETEIPLAVPIKVRGNIIGVLDTYKPAQAGEWTAEEVTLLETLADQLGAALESARLYQDAQRRAARERFTREITDKMRRATNVEGIVQTVVDELFSMLGTSRAFVRLGASLPAQNGGNDGHK